VVFKQGVLETGRFKIPKYQTTQKFHFMFLRSPLQNSNVFWKLNRLKRFRIWSLWFFQHPGFKKKRKFEHFFEILNSICLIDTLLKTVLYMIRDDEPRKKFFFLLNFIVFKNSFHLLTWSWRISIALNSFDYRRDIIFQDQKALQSFIW